MGVMDLWDVSTPFYSSLLCTQYVSMKRHPSLQHLAILDVKVFASVYILELVEQYILSHFDNTLTLF